MKTKQEILEQVKNILARIEGENDNERGISETELDILFIELKLLEGQMYKGFSRHCW